MSQTIKIVLLSTTVVAMIAVTVAVKMIWFPSINEAWFQNNGRALRQARQGLVMVRPTRYPNVPTNSIIYAADNRMFRMAGRNVTFQILMATAYSHNPGRVSLPENAPKGNFDFVVTGPQDRLPAAVLRRTGYSAKVEAEDTDVLALKVEDPNSPGLTVSGPNEKQNVNFKKGRLTFSHMKLSEVVGGLESVLKSPVVDETGLTNYYDFSLAWSSNMRAEKLTREDLDKIVEAWGLKFEPDTESIEMLVVKKAD